MYPQTSATLPSHTTEAEPQLPPPPIYSGFPVWIYQKSNTLSGNQVSLNTSVSKTEDKPVIFWKGTILWPHVESQTPPPQFSASISPLFLDLIESYNISNWPSILGCHSLYQTVHATSDFNEKISKTLGIVEFIPETQSREEVISILYSTSWKGYWAADVDFPNYCLTITPYQLPKQEDPKIGLIGIIIKKE